jgi:hypothetical protein
LVGGTIAGVLFATRAPLQTRNLERRIDAQKAEPEEAAPLLTPPEPPPPNRRLRDTRVTTQQPNRARVVKSTQGGAVQPVARGEIDTIDLEPAAAPATAPSATAKQAPKPGIAASAALGSDLFDSVR